MSSQRASIDSLSSPLSPRGRVFRGRTPTLARVQIDLVAIVVDDYDPAIKFFVEALSFDLVDDSPSLTTDGRAKRWVVVRPPGAHTGILLARADGQRQAAVVGDQVAGRVGFFLRVNDFDAAYGRMTAAGVRLWPQRARSPTGAWQSSSTLPATGGTYLVPPDRGRPRRWEHAALSCQRDGDSDGYSPAKIKDCWLVDSTGIEP